MRINRVLTNVTALQVKAFVDLPEELITLAPFRVVDRESKTEIYTMNGKLIYIQNKGYEYE